MSKFYAVKKGRNPGVYESWDECKSQVNGFPNAVYKSFPTYEEANNFIVGITSIEDSKKTIQQEKSDITAYIDGSYDDKKKLFSYAGIIFFKDEKRIEFAFADSDTTLVELRNVAGEIKAAMYAINIAIENKAKSIDIYYDYMGIESWANKEWKAKNSFTKHYVDYIDAVKPKINIYFKKVKSHSGNKYNDEVDLLAKQAIEDYAVTLKNSNSDVSYTDFFTELSPTKKSIHLNVLVENQIYDSENFYKLLKSKWVDKGYKLKDILEIKTLLDLENKVIIFIVNTSDTEEVLKFNLKEFNKNG